MESSVKYEMLNRVKGLFSSRGLKSKGCKRPKETLHNMYEVSTQKSSLELGVDYGSKYLRIGQRPREGENKGFKSLFLSRGLKSKGCKRP